MIHLCDNCHKIVELPIEELARRKKRNKGGRVFCTKSCTSSFYHPSNATKHLTSLTPDLVARATPVKGIAVQALPKSEVGDRGVGEANLISFDKENEMVTPGTDPEEKVPAQPLTAQDVVSIVTDVFKGLMSVQGAPSTPIAAPIFTGTAPAPVGGMIFTPGPGNVPTTPADNSWRLLDDTIHLASCDAQLCDIPTGITSVWYIQGDGSRVAVPRENQLMCQRIGSESRYMTIAGPQEQDSGRYFAVPDRACFRCGSRNPSFITATNPKGDYSKGWLSIRNIAGNYRWDVAHHGAPRANGVPMDFSINGRLPSTMSQAEYQALIMQLHPIDGVVTTDVTIPTTTVTINDDVVEAPF